jgi:hypothetical protein
LDLPFPDKKAVGLTEEPSFEDTDENYLSDGAPKDKNINHSSRKVSQ